MSAGLQHVLVVEDEEKIARVLGDYLRAAGYTASHLASGSEVVPWVRAHAPDLVLLDVMLPGLDGLSVCRALRQVSAVPVIFVTARAEEVDRLLGLDAGADDYVCKPFSPREVVARVKAVLRRPSLARGEDGTLRVGPLLLDEPRHRATLDGAVLELTTSEFKLLRVLGRSPGRVFSRAQLLDALHGSGEEPLERAIDTHVKNLRRKLGTHAGLLRSVYGAGYQLDA